MLSDMIKLLRQWLRSVVVSPWSWS